jgi:hypothetical protein
MPHNHPDRVMAIPIGFAVMAALAALAVWWAACSFRQARA